MSNATDNLIEAEKMIRSTFPNLDDQERSLQICSWLFGFNSIEKSFKIKCRRRDIPDICFCIDRHGYGDCEPEKVKTWFLSICIKKAKLIFRPIPLSTPYLKQEASRPQLLTFINYSESKKLDLETIKIHIFESYKLLLNNLKLVTNVSSTNNNAPQQSNSHNSYLPTKEDVDVAEAQLRKNAGEIIGMETVLDQVEINYKNTAKTLKVNWRDITKQNIPIWFSNNNSRI